MAPAPRTPAPPAVRYPGPMPRRSFAPLLLLAALLVAACGTAPPAAPTGPFACEDAGARLGYPDAVVAACGTLPNLPDVYQVALDGPTVPGGHLVRTLVVAHGEPVSAHGDSALRSYLAALPPDRRRALTMEDVTGLLRAFDAFPMGFDHHSWNFDTPGVGRSSFTPEPFELVLYAAVPPQPLYLRARLGEDAGRWTWRIEGRSADGQWALREERALDARSTKGG